MTQPKFADRIRYSLDTVKSIESGRLLGSDKFAQVVDKAFDTDDHLARLREFINRISMQPWFRDRIEVERKARQIHEYDSYQIPGLLQTEEYMRAAAQARRPMLPEDDIELAVALRLERQQILEPDQDLPIDQDQMPHLWVIMDEAALKRKVGSSETMRAQHEHLIVLAQRPNITIQIIPNSEGMTCAYGRSFAILTSGSGSSVVYLEDVRSARYIRDRDQTAQYVIVFDTSSRECVGRQ